MALTLTSWGLMSCVRARACAPSLRLQAQDDWALRSHQRAAAAVESGIITAEITAVKLGDGSVVSRDDLIRPTMSAAKIQKLGGVFRTACRWAPF